MSTPSRSEAIEMPYGMPHTVAPNRADQAAELRIAAAALAFASGVVHLTLVVPHLRQSVALAVLFSAAGVAEILWSAISSSVGVGAGDSRHAAQRCCSPSLSDGCSRARSACRSGSTPDHPSRSACSTA